MLPQVSRRHTDVPAVQQGLDQREDLRAAPPSGPAKWEASEEVEGRVGMVVEVWGGSISFFLISNLCSDHFKLFWEVFGKVFKVFFFLSWGRSVLYCNVWLINKDFLSKQEFLIWVCFLLLLCPLFYLLFHWFSLHPTFIVSFSSNCHLPHFSLLIFSVLSLLNSLVLTVKRAVET